MTEFSIILAKALERVASEYGLSYKEGGDMAWGQTGASYLSYTLCSLPASALRSIQYKARELTGPILLDCKWYDRMMELCLDGKDNTSVCIPTPQGDNTIKIVSKDLFLEMLDFCREG